MIAGLMFPKVPACVMALVDGLPLPFGPVNAVRWLATNPDGSLPGPFPLVHITEQPGGTQGDIDRVTRITIDCYAPGDQAVDALDAVNAYITGTGIETVHGYLDEVRPITTPTDIPYASDVMNRANCMYDVTVRPVL